MKYKVKLFRKDFYFNIKNRVDYDFYCQNKFLNTVIPTKNKLNIDKKIDICLLIKHNDVFV